ncbi:MAG: crossover junction endodeoxyribonuclease RuvC [Proteobacteria bacterium]|nr:crossover junction endodeoxyribonuclease RuvC [Pseudomonadota bacterium]
MRRILGIDPGSRITGFGVIELKEKRQPCCLLGGCIRLGAKEMPLRLGQLFTQIQDIVKQFKPTELAIEQVFVQKNALSALKLGQARGVCIAAAMSLNMPVYEYAPKQIKQAITGKGNADKSQIQHMIQILLTLNVKPQADAADALAVALCHSHMLGLDK